MFKLVDLRWQVVIKTDFFRSSLTFEQSTRIKKIWTLINILPWKYFTTFLDYVPIACLKPHGENFQNTLFNQLWTISNLNKVEPLKWINMEFT